MAQPEIGILVLAAGSSSRLGRPKQLVAYSGKSLIRRAAEAALGSGLGPVLVVLGSDAAGVRHEIADLDVETAVNQDWESGMSSTIRCGLQRLIRPRTEIAAVVIMLCDQPLVSADALTRLAHKYRETGKSIVASRYNGTLGVPALFDRSTFDRLLSLIGDRGAKSLIMSRPEDVAQIDTPEAAFDIDSAEDLEGIGK